MSLQNKTSQRAVTQLALTMTKALTIDKAITIMARPRKNKSLRAEAFTKTINEATFNQLIKCRFVNSTRPMPRPQTLGKGRL